jgi:hypothetical protein
VSVMAGRHADRARHAHRAGIVRRMVVDKTDIARGLQKELGGWLIMWSKWRQTYTAFACTTTEPLIIDEAEIGEFKKRIEQVELARRGAPAGGAVGWESSPRARF